MTFAALLDDVLGQKSKIQILRLLLRTHGQLTGRDIARQTGLNHRTCHTALGDLARQGIVLRMRAGTAYLYKLNEEHVLVNGALARLFGAEQDLIEEYAQAAKKGLGIPVESVILYGSVARGTESPGSDVDLMFIVRDARTAERGREQLGSLTASLARKFGSVPQIVFSDVPGFRNGVKRRDPYYSSVLREGRVLYGKALAELLRNGA